MSAKLQFKKMLRKASMLEQPYYVQLENLPGDYVLHESPLQTPFTKARRNVLLIRALVSLKYFIVALLYRSVLIFGKAVL